MGFLDMFGSSDEKLNKKLIEAVIHGDLKSVKRMLEKGADVDFFHTTAKGTMNSLMLASAIGNIQIVYYLLENGANVNAVNKFNQTALHFAASKGQVEVASVLLDSGADQTILDNNRNAPINIAGKKLDQRMVLLLTKGLSSEGIKKVLQR